MDQSASTSDLRMQSIGRNTKHPRPPLDQSKIREDAEFWPLSAWKPYFHVVLSKTHLAKRFQLVLPQKLSEKLPAATVPATIICRGKVWDLVYIGDQANKKFQNQKWGEFVTDNKLAVGDVCVFELMEGSSNSRSIKFKVQILRDEFPLELLEKAEGSNKNNPIDLD